jgi:hypothetical protein
MNLLIHLRNVSHDVFICKCCDVTAALPNLQACSNKPPLLNAILFEQFALENSPPMVIRLYSIYTRRHRLT